jgi:hypothetical protein
VGDMRLWWFAFVGVGDGVLLDGALWRVSWASCWMWIMAMRVSVVNAGEVMSYSYCSSCYNLQHRSDAHYRTVFDCT